MRRQRRRRKRNQQNKWFMTIMVAVVLLIGSWLSGGSLEWDSMKGWLSGEIGGFAQRDAATQVDGEGQLRVIFLDVGQGASQLIISPEGKTMLIDGGNNDKEDLMLSYLARYGVKRLDILIGTHPDADHIGGLDKVVDHLEIGDIYMPRIQANTKTYQSLLESIQRKGLKVKTAKAGLDLPFGEQVRVKMLAPVTTTDDSNNMSAVVKLNYGSTSYLLTGDAGSESEQAIIESGADLRADVMLVGHHGSKSSTTRRFLQLVQPTYAVIQVGPNSYGHPTQTILDRLDKQNVQTYRNDTQGTVEITTDGRNYQITTDK